MSELVPYLLLFHVLATIVAFGPTFAFPLIGAMGGKEPMHANFGARVSLRIAERITLPLAAFLGISGILLIWSASIDLLRVHWLLLSIALYVVGMGFVILVQIPNSRLVVDLSTMPAAGPPPAGPPPGLSAAIRRVQLGGMLMMVIVVVIVCLKVLKPTFF